jgi:ABC-type thiamin/hydroxymethylpyrimidine transport system permease subunit
MFESRIGHDDEARRGFVSRALGAFSTRELVLIAVLAALGIAIKPVVVPIAHMIAAPFLVPGGAFAGGLYMMWLVVGMGLVGKRGTATLIALIQALLVMFTGVPGSWGVMSLVIYTMPGLAVDVGLLAFRHRACCLRCCFLAGMVANVTGTLMVSAVMLLPTIPLMLGLCTAALSGGVGGILSWQVLKELRRFHIAAALPGTVAAQESRVSAGRSARNGSQADGEP